MSESYQAPDGGLVEQVRSVVEADPGVAERLIEEYERAAGKDGAVLTAKAYVEAAYGRLAKSEKLLRSRLDQSLDPPALLLFVMILSQQGRGVEAIEPIGSHGSIDDPDVHASRFLISVELEGRSLRSEADLSFIPSHERKGQIAVAGNVALTRRDRDQARAMAAWASEFDGVAPDLERLLASLALGSGRNSEATLAIDEYWNRSESDSKWAFLEGVRLSNERRFEEAAARFSEALASRPHWRDAQTRAATVALKLGRWVDVESLAVTLERSSRIDALALRLAAALKRRQVREFIRLVYRARSAQQEEDKPFRDG